VFKKMQRVGYLQGTYARSATLQVEFVWWSVCSGKHRGVVAEESGVNALNHVAELKYIGFHVENVWINEDRTLGVFEQVVSKDLSPPRKKCASATPLGA
jgi:hypothetical protein